MKPDQTATGSENYIAVVRHPQKRDSMVKLHRKFPLLVYLGSVFFICLVIMAGAISLYLSDAQKDKEQWVEHTYRVLDNVKLIHQNLTQMVISKRDYNLTGALLFLKQYNSSSVSMGLKLNALHQLVKDNPAQQLRINHLQQQIDSLMNFWRIQKGNSVNIFSRSEARPVLAENDYVRHIAASVSEINDAEHQLLVLRENGNSALRKKINYSVIAATLIILIIISFLIYVTLRELSRRLTAYQQEIEINKLKSSFISLASHEFRTPLSAILLSSSLIEKYGAVYNDDNISKHIKKIKATVYNLKGILDDFLSIEKLNAGTVTAHAQPLDLVGLCEDITEEMRTILLPGQQLYYENTGTIRQVLLDENLLRNAIINLVSNAVKYAGPKAIIEITTEITDKWATIEIKDNGVGIAKKDQKELFSQFYRINESGTIPGTGLGLNIVHRYVSLMNGTLSFKSKPAQGAQFRMSFPMQADQ